MSSYRIATPISGQTAITQAPGTPMAPLPSGIAGQVGIQHPGTRPVPGPGDEPMTISQTERSFRSGGARDPQEAVVFNMAGRAMLPIPTPAQLPLNPQGIETRPIRHAGGGITGTLRRWIGWDGPVDPGAHAEFVQTAGTPVGSMAGGFATGKNTYRLDPQPYDGALYVGFVPVPK